jgi:hypothetical protein
VVVLDPLGDVLLQREGPNADRPAR